MAESWEDAPAPDRVPVTVLSDEEEDWVPPAGAVALSLPQAVRVRAAADRRTAAVLNFPETNT
jgi:hypothetical protein